MNQVLVAQTHSLSSGVNDSEPQDLCAYEFWLKTETEHCSYQSPSFPDEDEVPLNDSTTPQVLQVINRQTDAALHRVSSEKWNNPTPLPQTVIHPAQASLKEDGRQRVLKRRTYIYFSYQWHWNLQPSCCKGNSVGVCGFDRVYKQYEKILHEHMRFDAMIEYELIRNIFFIRIFSLPIRNYKLLLLNNVTGSFLWSHT